MRPPPFGCERPGRTPLASYSGPHHALRDVPLREHEEDDRRKRVEGERHARQRPCPRGEQVRDPRQQRSVRVKQEEEVLGQVVAPDEDERPHGGNGDDGLRVRNEDVPEDAQTSAAVDRGGVLELAREGRVELAEDEDLQGRALYPPEHPWPGRVDQMQPVEDDELRNHRDDPRNHQRREHEQEDDVLPPDAVAGKRETGQRGRGRAQRRNRERVEERHPPSGVREVAETQDDGSDEDGRADQQDQRAGDPRHRCQTASSRRGTSESGASRFSPLYGLKKWKRAGLTVRRQISPDRAPVAASIVAEKSARRSSAISACWAERSAAATPKISGSTRSASSAKEASASGPRSSTSAICTSIVGRPGGEKRTSSKSSGRMPRITCPALPAGGRRVRSSGTR